MGTRGEATASLSWSLTCI